MQFRIADTFTASLAKLTNDQQKAAKTTAFDLQTNPANPGLSMHRLTGAKDPNFWSVRVSQDLRIIVHKTDEGTTLCYVDHHDDAYRWAERRKLETHPTTGAAQLVELKEVVQEIAVPTYVEALAPAKPSLFTKIAEDDLLRYGVPPEWLDDVMSADEDTILDLAEHLPAEAAEALLELAVGKVPQPSLPAPDGEDPFNHPDALRRFRVMHNVEELAQALEFPWEKWAVFLHPSQEDLVARNYNGPARVSGSAGTGKTVVALHRTAYLIRANPQARVLLATFSDALANLLKTKLARLVHPELGTGDAIAVQALDSLGVQLYEAKFGPLSIARREDVENLIREAADSESTRFSTDFVMAEWERVVDAWQLETWEEYRDIRRLGRYRRLSETQRQNLWPLFERVREGLEAAKSITLAQMFGKLTRDLSSQEVPLFDYIVVDEAQDASVAQLRFLAAATGGTANTLFFAGDLGQRIFQQPFSWKELGVDVRGRSHTLRINYRTSHQIRAQADRLLDPEIADFDGNQEERRGTISVFNGPAPAVLAFDSEEVEAEAVGDWLNGRVAEGLLPEEIALFVRSTEEVPRAIAAVKKAGLIHVLLDEEPQAPEGGLSISTMHLAKGLEFRAVAVMACDGEAIPLQSRVDAIIDEADLEEVYNTERNLLYVACTRARDHLLVTGVEPVSEFLDDLEV